MNILIIRLGALGDVVLSFAVLRAIREHHPQAKITFLTSPAFASLALECPFIDDVVTFSRPSWREFSGWMKLLKFFHSSCFDLVYDLQRNDRTSIYKSLSPKHLRKKWLGGAPSAYKKNPSALYAVDMRSFSQVPLDWMKRDLGHFHLPARYVLFVPGSAPQHPAKRWPAQQYAQLASHLAARGITPVLIGTAAEAQATAIIAQACPQAIDLTARTSFAEIAALAQQATAAVGNDTGPMHLISLCGCPVVSLFSNASDPAKSAPRGARVSVLQRPDLGDLPVNEVEYTLNTLLGI